MSVETARITPAPDPVGARQGRFGTSLIISTGLRHKTTATLAALLCPVLTSCSDGEPVRGAAIYSDPPKSCEDATRPARPAIEGFVGDLYERDAKFEENPDRDTPTIAVGLRCFLAFTGDSAEADGMADPNSARMRGVQVSYSITTFDDGAGYGPLEFARDNFKHPAGSQPVEGIAEDAYQESAPSGESSAGSRVVFRARNLEVSVWAFGENMDRDPNDSALVSSIEAASRRIAADLAENVEEIMPP